MKKQIGVIGIDSGLCWIGDPCYIHNDEGHKDSKGWGKDWPAFLEQLNQKLKPDDAGTQFNFDLGHPGLGVCVRSPHGDGIFPVFAEFENGALKRIVVEFD